ncbi:MAG: NADH:flavin oxidoreductase, partial [Treponema sp.]|nr:NADH:flavin oxidoreductase [Treponema sp.]
MKITDSVKIKNVTTKNRIAVPPMVMFHWSDENGFVTEKHIAHYDEIAKGHPGLVIVEATAINQNARLHKTELGLWDDSQIEGFKKITGNFHREGVPCFIQIVNAGINGDHDDVLCTSDMEIKRGDFVLHGHAMTQ